MRLLDFIFLTLLISFSSSMQIQSHLNRSSIRFYFDDTVTGFWINENPYSFPGKNWWNVLRSANFVLFPGDEIKIAGKNQGGGYGFVMTIDYVNQQGKKKTYVTNNQWKCDDAPPVLLRKIKSNPRDGYRAGMNEEAYVIWGKKKILQHVLLLFLALLNKYNLFYLQ